MKRVIYVFIALLFIPKNSLACSCGVWEPLDLEGKAIQSKFENYSSIVLAKVVKTKETDVKIREIGSVSYRSSNEETLFSSIKTWKGSHGSLFQTKINTDPASCGIKFEPGETYLLFLSNPKEENYFRTSSCSGNLRLERAEHYIMMLDELIYENNTKK